MRIELNYIIVWCRGKQKSARFPRDILGLPEPIPFRQMLVVPLSSGVSLDFFDSEAPIAMRHYAFFVSDVEPEQAFTRVRAKGLAYWADPAKKRLGETYEHNGGRGLYFDDPGGHFLEIMTRPYDLGSQLAYLAPLGQCDQGTYPPDFVRYRHDLARHRDSSRADCRYLARDAIPPQPR